MSTTTLVLSSDQHNTPDSLSTKNEIIAARGSETSYEQTLHVDVEHGDILTDASLPSFPISSLIPSEQEEYLMRHYSRTLGRWVW